MSPKLQALLEQIGKDDPRREALEQETHTLLCYEFSQAENGKPMCKAYLPGGVIATVLGSVTNPKHEWFRELAQRLHGSDSSATLEIVIENISAPHIFGGYGVIAAPVSRVEAESPLDQLLEFQAKPENQGKIDQRPRGRKDEDLMTILRIAARRNGYVDETPSAAYTSYINDLLWASVEQGLPFRMRHAIIDSKGGDAHYTAD